MATEIVTQRTPGPWVAHSIFVITDDGQTMIAKAEYGSKVGPEFSIAKLNAQVIAAAPDMLDALKAVKTSCPCDNDINPQFTAAWMKLEAAIAKAEGAQ